MKDDPVRDRSTAARLGPVRVGCSASSGLKHKGWAGVLSVASRIRPAMTPLASNPPRVPIGARDSGFRNDGRRRQACSPYPDPRQARVDIRLQQRRPHALWRRSAAPGQLLDQFIPARRRSPRRSSGFAYPTTNKRRDRPAASPTPLRRGQAPSARDRRSDGCGHVHMELTCPTKCLSTPPIRRRPG